MRLGVVFFVLVLFFFFFQAEDGIRDHCVTEFRRVLFRSAVLSLFLLFNVLRVAKGSLLSRLGHVAISFSSADILGHVPNENGSFGSGSHDVVLVR